MHSITNEEFLQAVFHDKGDDEAIGVAFKPGDPGTPGGWGLVPADSPKAKRFLESASNNYFCIASVNPQPAGYGLKRSMSDLHAVYVVPLDDVDPSMELPEPTYALETSPGNYQYGYVLTTPETDLAYAQAAIDLIAGNANSDPAAAIPNKLIRLPVGINGKSKYGSPSPACNLELFDPTNHWDLDDLLDAFNVSEAAMLERIQQVQSVPAAVEPGVVTDDELYKFLASEGMVLSAVPNGKGFVDILCPWHEEHTTGLTAGFSPLGCGGGDLAGARQFKCLHEHCADRGSSDLILWYLTQRLVLDSSSGSIYDVQYPHIEIKSARHMDLLLSQYGKRDKVPLTTLWKNQPSKLIVAGRTFAPGLPRIVRDLERGGEYFNTYTEPNIDYTESEDKIEPFLKHIEYMCKSEADNMLDYLAYTVHEPGTRVKFAPLIISPHEGTGRGWIKDLLMRLTARRVGTPNMDTWIATGYTDFLFETVVTVWDEIYTAEKRWQTADRLKELITEEYIDVNIKFGFKGTMPVYANQIFLTNRIDALQLKDESRRFWIIYNDSPPRDSTYFDLLYAALEDKAFISQVYSWLKRRLATAQLRVQDRAPRTEWSAMVIESSQDDTEVAVRAAVKRLRVLGHVCAWEGHLLGDVLAMGGPQITATKQRGETEYRRFCHIMSELGCTKHRVRDANGNRSHSWRLKGGTTVHRELCDEAAEDRMASPIVPISVD